MICRESVSISEMDIMIASYLFFIGAVFGSFAGAMVWRMKMGRKVTNERSECEHCHHKLSPLDLIPVVSWLWLRGKCRYCRTGIGWTPLLLELGLGAVFVLSYLAWPLGITSIYGVTTLSLWLVALVMLTILFIYDLRWFLLPDRIVWPLAVVGVGLFAARAIESDWMLLQGLLELSFALLPVSGLYYVLYTVSKGQWVGFGDVKLGIFIGLALGWQGAVVAVVLANFIGMLVLLPGLLSGKLSRKSQVPFGPFLIVGTVIAMLWWAPVLKWYLELIVF